MGGNNHSHHPEQRVLHPLNETWFRAETVNRPLQDGGTQATVEGFRRNNEGARWLASESHRVPLCFCLIFPEDAESYFQEYSRFAQ